MLKGLGDLGNLMKLQKEFKSAQKKITGTTREGTERRRRGEGRHERRLPPRVTVDRSGLPEERLAARPGKGGA